MKPIGSVLVVILFLSIAPSGFSQVREGTAINVSGMIEQISKGGTFLVVNEAKYLLVPETEIMDDRGNRMSFQDLKTGLGVSLEAIRNGNRWVARKIVLKHPKSP